MKLKEILHMGVPTLFLVCGSLVAFAQGGPSSSGEVPNAVEIVMEEVDASLKVELVLPRELARIAGDVRPRLMFDHAAISWGIGLIPVPDLTEISKGVEPRIAVDHAATSSRETLSKAEGLAQVAEQVLPRVEIMGAATSVLWQDLRGMPEVSDVVYDVFPRIQIERAERAILEIPATPQVSPPSEPLGPPRSGPPPSPTPLLWVMIGLAVGLLVGLLIWRITG